MEKKEKRGRMLVGSPAIGLDTKQSLYGCELGLGLSQWIGDQRSFHWPFIIAYITPSCSPTAQQEMTKKAEAAPPSYPMLGRYVFCGRPPRLFPHPLVSTGFR